MPSLVVGLALRWNWRRHKAGSSTICAWLRVIPWPVLRVALGVFFAWWWTHLRDGYPN